MKAYSTGRFVTLLAASIIIALALAYSVTTLVPSINPSHGPSYELSTTPSSLQVTPGAAGSYTLKLTSQFGFSGLLKLAARVPNAPNSLAVSLAPAELQLSAGGSASTTLNVATNPVTPAGTYSIVGFSVSANPASLIFQPNATGTSTISITSVNGFSGQVNLFASSSASGPTVSVSPNTLLVPENRTVTSTLTVQSSAQGRFDVTVTVIGDQFYQSVSLPVAVTSSTSISGNFSMTVIPGSFEINPGNFRNVIVEVNSIGDCGCLVTISTSTSASFAYGIGPYIVQVPVGGSANSTVTLSANPGAALGIYTVTVTGTSLSIAHSTQLTVTVTTAPVPDMKLTANPLFVTVAQGASSTASITVASIAGFSGTVYLTGSVYGVNSSAITLNFNPTSVTLAPNGTVTSDLTITASASASLLGYNFTVTGTSGTLTRGAYGNIIVIAPPAGMAPLAVQEPTSSSVLTSGLIGQVLAASVLGVEAGSVLSLAGLATAVLACAARPDRLKSSFPQIFSQKIGTR
ncbi:hypothetical protein E6H15_07970 [Candidatus Bathyarchaeota archaeon]|nr:MAG: hypothetical protein E6H15_07970 [Candidatus Bathyarchaeota archaeon]